LSGGTLIVRPISGAQDGVEVVGVHRERLDVAFRPAGEALAAVVMAEGQTAALAEPAGDPGITARVLGGAVRQANDESRPPGRRPCFDVQAGAVAALDLPRRVVHRK